MAMISVLPGKLSCQILYITNFINVLQSYSSRFRKSSPANCSIHVGDIGVPQIHSVKDLGAFLDTHMTLKTSLERSL